MQSSQSLIVGGNDYFDSWLSRSWESWTENIKELYVDRELESYIPVPNLVKLEIGKSIQKIPVSSISSISTLDTIYSYAKVPPTLPSMTNKHYINTIVKVPADALDAYKNANNWKNFWNLSAMESSGINDIKNESKTEIIGRYDLNGNKVDENYNGITIVRFSDGSTRKMINKSN